jgi:hypothetical protein
MCLLVGLVVVVEERAEGTTSVGGWESEVR